MLVRAANSPLQRRPPNSALQHKGSDMRHLGTVGLLATALICATQAQCEILAMMNYESKTAEALKAFRNPVPGLTRQEGIAIIDVDPASPNFKKVVETLQLPPDLVAHHIFFNRDSSKAYVTSLAKSERRLIHLNQRP